MKRYLATALVVAALGCSEAIVQPPSPPPAPPPPPPMQPPPPPPTPPTTFGIRPALDTAAIGETLKFVAERADSTVDAWVLSDTTTARLVAHARGWVRVVARAPGTVTLKATRQGASGQASLVVRQPLSFVLRPGLDTIPLGSQIQLVAEAPDSTVDAWVISDTSIARLGQQVRYYATVVALAPGTVTITARRGADSGQATLVVSAPPPAPAGWDVIDLGIMDAVGGRPLAINDIGTIVGRLRYDYPNGTSEYRGFTYQDGVMRKLGGRDTLPLTIGPTGAIGGVTLLPNYWQQFVVWDSPDAAPRALANGAYSSDGTIIGLNARGDVLANIGTDGLSVVRRARLWRSNAPQDLGQLNDTIPMWTQAMAWNSRGQIVGFSPVSRFIDAGDKYYQIHPVLWENGVMRDLGIFATRPCNLPSPVVCGEGIATAINMDGTVVGWTTADSGLQRAFIWQNGELRDLGVFPGQFTSASAINDRGQVLGAFGPGYYSQNATFLWENGHAQVMPFTASILGANGEVVGSRDGHIFIWEAGHVTDLGEGSPVAMNGRGEIIGTRGALPTLWRKKRG